MRPCGIVGFGVAGLRGLAHGLLGALGLLGAASAQLPPTLAPVVRGPTVSPPAIAVGNFSGHGYQDVAYMQAQQAVMRVMPTLIDNQDALAVGLEIRDLAARGGAPQHRDALLMATSAGVMQWSPLGLMALLDPRAFGRLVCTDIDGDGVVDLLGLDTAQLGNGKVFVRTYGALPVPMEIQFSGETLRDVAPIDWDGDGIEEIAVATDSRLWVGNAVTHSSVFSYPLANTRAHLARLRSPTGQRLVWVARGSSGRDTVHVVGSGVFEQLNVPFLVAGIGTGDCNGDGYDDLALSRQDTLGVALMRNLRVQPTAQATFALRASVRVAFDAVQLVPSVNRARPVIADLDADGAVEICMPLPDSLGLGIVRTPSSFLGGQTPQAPQPQLLDFGVSLFIPPSGGPLWSYDFMWLLDPTVVPPPGANAVQALFYSCSWQPAPQASSSFTGGASPGQFYTVPGVVFDVRAGLVGGLCPPSVTASLRVPAGVSNLVYAGFYRFVELDAAGDVMRAFAPRLFGFGTDSMAYLIENFPGNPPVVYRAGGGFVTWGYTEPPDFPPKRRFVTPLLPFIFL